MTDDQFNAIIRRLDDIDGRLANLATLQEETALEVAAVKTRLGHVESTTNRIAARVGVQSIPSLGGSGQPVESMAAKGSDTP